MQGEVIRRPLAQADGTKHPVIKRDYVVKHDAVYQKQTVGS